MKKSGNAFLSVVGMAVLTLSASCAAPVSDAPRARPVESSQSGGGLAAVDVCSLLKPDDLEEFGLIAPGEFDDSLKEEPVCDYSGEQFDVAVHKHMTHTVESYGKTSAWKSYKPISVAGRPAAQAVSNSATDARLCFTLIDSGGGVAMVSAQEVTDGGMDSCAQSTKIAKRIASRLPR